MDRLTFDLDILGSRNFLASNLSSLGHYQEPPSTGAPSAEFHPVSERPVAFARITEAA